MSRLNIHVTTTPFKHESRIIKEAYTFLKKSEIEQVLIIARARDNLPLVENFDRNIKVRRLRLFTDFLPKFSFLKYFKFLEYSIRVLFIAKKNNPKLVNIHSIDLIILGWLIKSLTKSKLVYDAHELETERNGLGGISKKIAKFLEGSLIKKYDYVFVVSKSIFEWYINKYQHPNQALVMNAPYLSKVEKSNYLREKFNIPVKKKIIIHHGFLTFGRGIELLIETLNLKNTVNDDAVFVFLGYGPLVGMIEASAKINKYIFYHGPVDSIKLNKILSSADVGIHLAENICLSYEYSLPNKFFEFANAGLPLITANLQDMRNMVEHYQNGLIIKDYDSNSIVKTIEEILKLDLKILSKNSRKLIVENSWEIQEKKILEITRNL